MARKVSLDSRGVSEILKSSTMRSTIAAKTAQIARTVKAAGITVGDRDGGSHEYALPVEDSVVITDRAHGLVTLAHPAGLNVEAKHGILGKAALDAGLEVKRRNK